MKKEMLINVLQPEECRIAILEDGVLEELYVERTSQESYVGNIYKGRIVNIEPSIQAAFVDFGIGRNGFLHVSDVEPTYYRHLEPRRGENGGRRGRRGRPAPRSVPAPDEDELVDQYADAGEAAGDFAERLEQADQAVESDVESTSTEGGIPESVGEAAHDSKLDEYSMPPVADDSSDLDFPADSSPEHQERPRFMDSAEHRTEEERAPSGRRRKDADEDIFFPPTRKDPGAAQEERAEVGFETEPETRHSREVFEPAGTPPNDDISFPGSDHVEGERVDEGRHEFLPEHEPADNFELAAEDRPPLDESHQNGERGARELPADELEEPRRGPRRRRPQRDDRRGRPPRRLPGRPGAGRPKPPIQEIFRRGQEVLVQVIKEGIGTKGPTLSTYISIAGRYLVLMPGLNRVGVSRKIGDDEQRRRLRQIFHELQPPKGLGFIIRTAGLDKTKKELQRDLAYLSRLWQVVVRRIRKLKSPAEIYQESDMITRTIRDTFTSDIDTIWVDEPNAYAHAREFLQIVMPRYANRINHYTGSEPLFHKYRIEEEIARIHQRHVPLPNGGSIVIDQTEALVAIDVNSGNFRADNNAEETAYQMNLLAAKEIARQLRLRDMGGVIVNDFIDMRDEKHRRDVERALREAVKRDRARTKILRISAFGLIEMTRQRIRPSLKRSVYQDCPYCRGTAQVKTCESMSIDVMRMIQLAAHRENIQRIQVRVHEDVASYLLNRKRKDITQLEESGSMQVSINGDGRVSPELLEFVCFDNNNNEVKFIPLIESRAQR
jgi:ribonuclease E